MTQPLIAINQLTEMFARDASEPSDMASTLDLVVQTAQNLFGADCVVLFAINPITGEFMLPPAIAGTLVSRTSTYLVL